MARPLVYFCVFGPQWKKFEHPWARWLIMLSIFVTEHGYRWLYVVSNWSVTLKLVGSWGSRMIP